MASSFGTGGATPYPVHEGEDADVHHSQNAKMEEDEGEARDGAAR